jgi:hypothetical protein
MRFVRWALGVAVVQGALLLLLAWLLDGFSVITLATVGYGDFAPRTTGGKLFTVGYVLVGVGLLGSFLSFLAYKAAELAGGSPPPSGRKRTDQEID